MAEEMHGMFSKKEYTSKQQELIDAFKQAQDATIEAMTEDEFGRYFAKRRQFQQMYEVLYSKDK